MTGRELEAYRKRQVAASHREQAKQAKGRPSWRGPTAVQRNALRHFSWSEVQIGRLTEQEVAYHVGARDSPSVRFGVAKMSASENRILKGEGTTMAAKKSNKGKAAKAKAPKRTGVGQFIKDLIMKGQGNETIRAAVIKKFGADAKAATQNHIPWYRGKLQRDGMNPPEPPEREKKAAKGGGNSKAKPKKADAKGKRKAKGKTKRKGKTKTRGKGKGKGRGSAHPDAAFTKALGAD